MTEYIEVVAVFDNTSDGLVDTRLSRIGKDWFVYTLSLHSGQVCAGNKFANHTASGIRYLFTPMTERVARERFAQKMWAAQNRAS